MIYPDQYGVDTARRMAKTDLAVWARAIQEIQDELDDAKGFFASHCISANKLGITDQDISDITVQEMTKGWTRGRIQQIRKGATEHV